MELDCREGWAMTDVWQKATIVSKVRKSNSTKRLMYESNDLEHDSLTDWQEKLEECLGQVKEHRKEVDSITEAFTRAQRADTYLLAPRRVFPVLNVWNTHLFVTSLCAKSSIFHRCLSIRLMKLRRIISPWLNTDYSSQTVANTASNTTSWAWIQINLYNQHCATSMSNTKIKQ